MLTSCSQEDEGAWVWKTEGNDLYFDPGTVVNVRIEQERWTDKAAGKKTSVTGVEGSENGDANDNNPAYELIGSMAEGGLGGLHWW
jgi:DNA-directed RNA polymerase subunit E'/Rpb7